MQPVPIACVAGARPNFVKAAALVEEWRRRPRFAAELIHTGQHFSPEMSDDFFRDLDLPRPSRNLGVGHGTPTAQIAAVMCRLEQLWTRKPPRLVLVVGDVNSTLAAALAASRLGIPVAHVEAGLRSFDRTMPEELNRVVTDSLAEYLFASEPSGVRNLLAEGVPARRIFLVGNVMIDTLLRFREKAAASGVLERYGLRSRGYAAVTLHRPSNVDDAGRLRSLVGMLSRLSRSLPVVFPVHPRTCRRMEEFGISPDSLRLLPPLNYLDFLKLMSEARMVLTDSGGIQEETTILHVPCLTLRENTERPVTIEKGTNRLAGTEPQTILRAALDVLDTPSNGCGPPELWDGRAGARIFDVLETML